MRTRHQIIDDLIEATEYHDTEIILNIDHIRDLFNDAIGHLKDASRVVRDNQRLRRHIKQLKADVARLQAQIPRWISVEERMPPDGIADYLVTIKQKYAWETEWQYYVDMATYEGSYIDGLWDTVNDWIEGQETHVTHWMPLPEPPKEGMPHAGN